MNKVFRVFLANWCPMITTIRNGRIIGYQNPPVVGTYLILICDPGFKPLNNIHFATCLANTQWSAKLQCVCKGGSYQYLCDAGK